MEDKEYWELSEEERIKQDIIDAKETEPKERYYIWDYCRSYGWRQMGDGNGYATVKELKKDPTYKYDIERKTPIRILKGQIHQSEDMRIKEE